MVEIMNNATDYHELETREWVLAALWSLMLVFFPTSFSIMNIIVGVPIIPT
jgi:hypothetical protein